MDHIFSNNAEDFHLKEYESLRKEIDGLTQEQRALERYALLAIGAIWTWLLKDGPKLAWPFVIPCLFSILGAIRAYGINQTFTELGGYIETIEKAFRRKGGPIGWEHFNNDYTENKGTPESMGAVFFWSALNIATAVVAVLRIRGRIY